MKEESRATWFAACATIVFLWGAYNQWAVIEMAGRIRLIEGKVLTIAGKVAVTDSPCCCSPSPSPSPSPSASPSPSPSASPSPSPSASAGPSPFPGSGWYCTVWFYVEAGEWFCYGGCCRNITTQAEWDSYQFGTNRAGLILCEGGTTWDQMMVTTNGTPHVDGTTCNNAGCACP